MLGLDWLHWLLLALVVALLAFPAFNARAVAFFQHVVVGTLHHALAMVGLGKAPPPAAPHQ